MSFSDTKLRHRTPVKGAPKIVEKRTRRRAIIKQQTLSPRLALFFAVILYLTTFHRVDSTTCMSNLSSEDHSLIEANPNSSFLLPNHLKPGQVFPLLWKEDGSKVDNYARLVGLSPQLTADILSFCEKSGLLETFWDVSYEDGPIMEGQSSEFISLKGGYKGKWAYTSPGSDSNWPDSNLRWFDIADEMAFEEALQVLKHAGFDTVLDAIGKEFKSDGLMIAGFGFIVVSHTTDGDVHADNPAAKDKIFTFLFPLILPEHEKAELCLGDEDEKRIAPWNYTRNVGALMSGDTTHATGACDYRESKGLRVSVSVYIADLNRGNVRTLASDNTALFPVPGNTEWLMTQKGRHWGKGNSLWNDKGRKPYSAKDDKEDCPALAEAGKCESDPWTTREKCQKSCQIFIDDEIYYSEVVGTTETA